MQKVPSQYLISVEQLFKKFNLYLTNLSFFSMFSYDFFFSDLKVKTDDDLIKKEQLTVTPTSTAEESA